MSFVRRRLAQCVSRAAQLCFQSELPAAERSLAAAGARGAAAQQSTQVGDWHCSGKIPVPRRPAPPLPSSVVRAHSVGHRLPALLWSSSPRTDDDGSTRGAGRRQQRGGRHRHPGAWPGVVKGGEGSSYSFWGLTSSPRAGANVLRARLRRQPVLCCAGCQQGRHAGRGCAQEALQGGLCAGRPWLRQGHAGG